MKRNERLIPEGAVAPILFNFGAHLVLYYLPKAVHLPDPVMLRLPFDDRIPLVPFFVVFYLGAFVQWGIGYLLLARGDRRTMFRFISAELIAKTVCTLFFIFLPTMIVRPADTGGGVFGWILGVVYRLDSPINLFPSVHCVESWFDVRIALAEKGCPRWLKIAMPVMTALVFASTVLVKQHYIVDILGGVLAAEAGLLLTDLFRTDRILERAFPGKKSVPEGKRS